MLKKNQIKSVRIERVADNDADTSCLWEYTDTRSAWAICVHCGEYLAIAEHPNERAEEIKDKIVDLEGEEISDENINHNEELEALRKELNNLSLHDCPHSRREYNYFIPYAGGEAPGSEDYQTYGKQDFQRMQGLNRGDWYFVGVIAKAAIVTASGTLQTIRSGGLWGIESDSGAYLDEVGKQELDSLRAELVALGFGKRAIDYAFKDAETVDK